MELIVNNNIISESIYNILVQLQSELTNGKLAFIENKGSYVRVSCPFHKDGLERNPSCSVSDSEDIPKGTFHCFTCGEKGDFVKFVAACKECSRREAETWLIKNFGIEKIETIYIKPCVKYESKVEQNDILDESILSTFENYHPYMSQRKLSKEVIEKFEVKYDKDMNAIVFPVRDFQGRLIGLTRRLIAYKKYILPKFKHKPIYLLNEVTSSDHVFVCESQINALYLWSLGYKAIALFGTGSSYQYDKLNKSGIKHYILCFDGDEAGRKAIKNFKSNIKSNCFIDVLNLSQGKDINDLSPEEVSQIIGDIKCK